MTKHKIVTATETATATDTATATATATATLTKGDVMETILMTHAKYDVGDQIAFKDNTGLIVKAEVVDISVTIGEDSEVYYKCKEMDGTLQVVAQDSLLGINWIPTPLFALNTTVQYLDDETGEIVTDEIKEINIRLTNVVDEVTKETSLVYDTEYFMSGGDEIYEDDIGAIV